MMKRFFRFIYNCHKWFGIPLALMFLIWYVSGIVMLYHQFPRLTPSTTPMEKVDRVELQSLWDELPDSIRTLRLFFSGQRLQITANGTIYGGYAPQKKDLERIAESFGTTPATTDTLSDIDKWIPFNQLMKHLPIYRVTGSDGSYTYVSSQTGEVLQHNTVSGRRWAWFGALPHYVYITPLRRDADLWRKTVIWMSGLSTISVIFGLVIAVRFLIKRKKWVLFRNRIWQWHYSWGLVFGIFMLAFIFSGMMSLAKIPSWIMKERPVKEESAPILKEDIDIDAIPEVFAVVTLSNRTQPLLNVIRGENSETVSALKGRKADFSTDYITEVVEHQTGEKVTNVSDVTDDIFYYQDGIKGYKADTDNFTAYWNDRGYYRLMDRKSKAQAVCYRILHTMSFPLLNRNIWLHDVFMWIILLGGLMIVVTGTILSVKAVFRK